MSTRTTIIRTADEHWFTEGTPELIDGEYLSGVLTIDIGAATMVRFEHDKEGVSVDIKPGTELYRILMDALQKKVGEQLPQRC